MIRPDEQTAQSLTELPTTKLWGGRFDEPTDAFVEAFTASVGFDQRLFREDIAGSIAHAKML
ncbi:MAG: argininosuccinate lyase, partial [Halothiobacillus sp.]|nr:argininosuccinate lyase [Halothiobacillus sp.]